MTRRIGALTISQSPRHDLLAPLYIALRGYEIIEAGALDDSDTDHLPDGSDTDYPLTTRLTTGEHVTLSRDFLAPLLQSALDKLSAQDVELSILLCAGDFPELKGTKPLIQPTAIAQQILRAMHISRIAVISPIDNQRAPINRKWTQAGFVTEVWSMPADATSDQQAQWINSQLETHPEISCVVLDYVGYPTDAIQTLQQQVNKPLFDLGHLAIRALVSML